MDEGELMYWPAVILIIPYLCLILLIYRNILRLKPFTKKTVPSVFISVIVPCRNEEKSLPRLLKCLIGQEYPVSLHEIIIVDDSSSDGTSSVASTFKSRGNIITIKNKGEGKKQALRTGIAVAKGSLIVTTDADCTMGTEWLLATASFYDEGRPGMIVGPVTYGKTKGFFSAFQSLEFLALQAVTAGSLLSGRGTMCNGANLAFEKGAYLDHSHELRDDIQSGDDVFLLHSFKKDRNIKIKWLESRDAIAGTVAASTLNGLLRQRSRWLSKAGSYKDRDTVITGIVTFVTVLVQASIMIAGIWNKDFLWTFAAVFLLKSVPDYLVIKNTANRYGEARLLGWYIPAQVVYPFYVAGVAICTIWYGISSPSRKGT